MPSQRKTMSKQILNQRRQTLLRLVDEPDLPFNLDDFSDVFQDSYRQLIATTRGSARARLLRHIARRSPQDDWDKLASIVDGLDHRRHQRLKRESDALSLRDSLIDGGADPYVVFGDSLSETDFEKLKKYIENARRYAATPLGKGARTRILKLLRQVQ